MEVMSSEASVSKYDMETDISKLEAPTFTTIDRSNPASMLGLDWDQQVNLVGKKVLNPMIHSCDKCLKPILIYGRMIPCKHVFCLGCAKQEEVTGRCPRCNEKVVRVEQAGLGNIFLCTIGGSRYGNNGCRRTYLSGRDLQAHIAHRHSDKRERDKAGSGDKKKEAAGEESSGLQRSAVSSISKASLASVLAAVNSAASSYSSYSSQLSAATAVTAASSSYSGSQVTQSHGGSGMNISVLNTRPPGGNLITIHAQEAAAASTAATTATATAYSGYPGGQTSYHAPYAAAPPPAAASPAVTSCYPNLSQPPPTYSGYSGGYGAGAAAAPPAAGYQYPAAHIAGQSTAAAGSYPAAGGQPGHGAAGYGGAGSYGVAPGTQHWTRPPPASQPTGYYRR